MRSHIKAVTMAEFKVPSLPMAAPPLVPVKAKTKEIPHAEKETETEAPNVAKAAKEPVEQVKADEGQIKTNKVVKKIPAKELPPIPYKEPPWSGLPPQGSGYAFEVLKGGAIVEEIDLVNVAQTH